MKNVFIGCFRIVGFLFAIFLITNLVVIALNTFPFVPMFGGKYWAAFIFLAMVGTIFIEGWKKLDTKEK